MSTTLTDTAAVELAHGLTLIRRRARLAEGTPQLMRYTINAVYRIDDYVVRLARGDIARQRAERVVAGTALLHRHGVPTVELMPNLAQPVVVDDWVATVWHYLPHPPDRPAPAELAAPLARLHAIVEHPAFLPQWSPVTTARRRLTNVLALDSEELNFTRKWAKRQIGLPLDELVATLTARCDNLHRYTSATSWQLPVGLIHGDAHAGNLLAGRLIDLDSLAIGPREWDLVPLAHSVTRFGDPIRPYLAFTEAYGFDLTTAPTWPLLRDVRELQLVTSVLDKLAGRPEVADILGHRLRTYLNGDHETPWERYR